MTNPDLAGRTPTVQRAPAFPWPRWRTAPRRAASPLARDPRLPEADAKPPPTKTAVPSSERRTANVPRPSPTSAPAPSAAKRPAGSLGGWLVRESIALVGMAGAALTVFAQLAWIMPLSRPYLDILGRWLTLSSNFWIDRYEALGFYLHSHLQAAVALAVFLAVIGLGARISDLLSGVPLARRWGFMDGMTRPIFAIMSVLAVIFLLSFDPNPASPTYDVTSKSTIQYLFVILLTAGYALGNHLGQRGFQIRLYRLAVLLALLVALNFWLLPSP
jgi:hypothetical protein